MTPPCQSQGRDLLCAEDETSALFMNDAPHKRQEGIDGCKLGCVISMYSSSLGYMVYVLSCAAENCAQ
jgi:hypothetical protein